MQGKSYKKIIGLYQKLVCAIVLPFLLSNALQSQNLSNRGKEFWLAYGHNALFDDGGGNFNRQQLVLYISTQEAAVVTISVNGTAFTQTYNIPANTVQQTVEIPKSGANDARLRTEGISDRGIRISSNVPVVAYAHQFGVNSSGATMLMPVETFGYTYYSLNYTQANPAHSWFFVVASENNTRIEITPSARTHAGKAPGVPFNINLQRGQVYNVFGQLTPPTGADLTGSKIRSIQGADGKCHPIAVFSGSSRMEICGGSREVMQQQITPASAWGTKYLTYSTVRTDLISQANMNFYRVAVRDPATVVRRNGQRLFGLQRGFFYEFSASDGDYIEADKPILVAQYVPSNQNSGCGYIGLGDPEMFFLSPLEQAIKSASFFAASNQNITRNYVSIILPNAGVASLRVNGTNVMDVLKTHPGNTAYSVAIKSLASNSQHSITSDSAFTAITYGFGDVESYGYNAGTLVNNLDAIPGITNTLSQVGATEFTCPGSPFNFSIKLSYPATRMVWRFSQVTGLSSTQDTTLINPVPDDTVEVGNRLFYEYRLPRVFTIADTGSFQIPISVTAPGIENCENTLEVVFQLKVSPAPKASFAVSYNGCRLDSATLTGINTGGGFNINRYLWTFPGGETDTSQSVKKLFPTVGVHQVRFRAVADNGCFGDTVKAVQTHPSPIARFGYSPPSPCIGSSITFTDTSTYSGGAIDGRFWQFDNGDTITVFARTQQVRSFAVAGRYPVKHVARVGSCVSDTAVRVVQVYDKPQVSFSVPVGCLADSVAQFTNTTTISDGQPMTFAWNFNDPSATSANPNTSTAEHASHKYSAYNTYNVSLTATTANGCSATRVIPFTIGGFSPAINFTILNEANLCVQKPVQLRNDINVVTDSVYRLDIYWDAVNQPAVFARIDNPATGGVYTHQYAAFITPSAASFQVKMVVYSKGGCVSERTKSVNVQAAPAVAIAPINPACINGGLVVINQGSVSNGVAGIGQYTGVGISSGNMFNPAIAGEGSHQVKYVFTTSAGCSDSASTSIVVHPKPQADWRYNATCDSIRFTGQAVGQTSIASWHWRFGNGDSIIRSDSTPFQYRYATAGTYRAILQVTSSMGCKSDTVTKPVVYAPLPVPAFTVKNETTLCSRNLVELTNITNEGNDTITQLDIYWDYLNDPTMVQTIVNPTANAVYNHQYLQFVAPAIKPVTIRWVVYSRGGCVSESSKIISLHAIPQLSFNSIPQTCFNDLPVQLVASAANVQGIGIFRGSGTTTSGIFTPSAAGVGIHRVNYVFSGTGGCIDSSFITISVAPQPVANFGFTSVCIGDSTSFIDSSSVSTGSIAAYNWNFGDGTTSTIAAPTRVYNSYGNYNVQLTVTSDSGCISAPVSRTVTVHAKPLVDFTTSASVCLPGGAVQFTNLTSLPNGRASDLAYTWQFGDGAIGTAVNPSQVYADSNQYTIGLVAVSQAGCTDSTEKTFNAFYRKPVADFSISSATACQGEATLFVNESTAPNSSISTSLWRFGDGSVSSENDPQKTYALPGMYSVNLSVITPQGCTADTSQNIRVYLQPRVDAGVNLFVPEGSTYSLQPFVNDTTLRFLWTPADHLSSDTSLYPSATAVRTITYMLSATGEGNCTGTDTVRITVLRLLQAPNVFSPNGDGINDTWHIPGLIDYPRNVVEIFDRYGRSVYRSFGYQKQWDGTVNGSPLPVGTYYYVIDVRQPGYQQVTGSVTIIR